MTFARPILSRSLSFIVAGSALLLAACGGGGSSSAIGGTVTGLRSGLTLVMQDNGTDNLSFTGNGATSFTFAFPTTLSSGSSYDATVLTQPLGQTCSIVNASGAVDSSGDNVNSIGVTCTTTSSVVGSVTGLAPGGALTLSSNGTSLAVTSLNPTFAFPGVLATGSQYAVTIVQNPSGQTCTLSNATGTVQANTIATVTAACATTPAT
jgi:hypothetical protein